MENIVYLNNLYDFYKELLTDVQKNYFEDYYFNNLTLSEIAENYDVSRNAVHKNIKDTEKKLYDYEDKLKVYSKVEQIKELVKDNQTLYNKILEII